MIYELIAGIIIFIFSLLLHELGHLTALRKHYPKARVKWYRGSLEVGEEYMYEAMTKRDRRKIYLDGILWGLAPLIVYTVFTFWWGIIFLVMYLYGSKHDLKGIINNR